MNEGDNLSTNKTFSSKLRKYYVLKRLLNGEHLSYQRLADNYLVSRSSITNDLVFIKQLLTKDNVLLKFDNSGTFIGGGEENKQKVIKRIIANLVREIQTANCKNKLATPQAKLRGMSEYLLKIGIND